MACRDDLAMDRSLLSLFAKHPARFPRRLAAEFPHIFDVISLLWGHREMSLYFDRLLLQDRDARRGFPPAIANELFALREFHDTLYPQHAAKPEIWHSGALDR